MRKAKHGEPLAFARQRARGEDLDTECVDWPYRLVDGYGRLDLDGRPRGAHQVVLELAGFARPDAASEARHLCGRSPCVNLAHLRWGTRSENQQDRFRRHGDSMHGERNPRAVLTADQVSTIRVRRSAGESVRLLAEEFGVAPSTISMATTRRTWRTAA